MLGKFDIARTLREVAQLMTMTGQTPFKARAYENASRSVEMLEDAKLVELIDQGRLTEIDGIGDSLATRITELYRTGKMTVLEELRANLPPGFAELSRVPGLGPKKVDVIVKLGISTLAGLEEACLQHKLMGIKGFGEKTEQKILEGVRSLRNKVERILLSDALAVGEPLVAYIRECPAVVHAELAGSARRWRETVADLDIVVAATDVNQVMDRFVAHTNVDRVDSRGDTKCTVFLKTGLQVDMRVLPPEDFATALHHFTGSKEHHVRLRGIARSMGLQISEWGVHQLDEKGQPGLKLRIDSEEEVYKAIKLQYVPPEMRENQGEVELAEKHQVPTDLVEEADVRGMVHCHTVFSDGKNTVEEMARAADKLGLQYLTITDHSPTAAYAGGVTVERLKAQWDEIARVQELVKVHLLRGTESDILESGALDYPDSVLEKFDVVIASIHNRHGMDEDRMTARLIKAMKVPIFKIWGHALGRLLGQREPFACRVEEVLDALAESRGAVEVNGDPKRLDPEPRWIRAARERKIPLVLSSDAHSVPGLAAIRFAVHHARRGGVRRGEVLNTKPAKAFASAVKPA
jgi:DNA polymerase (family 10)